MQSVKSYIQSWHAHSLEVNEGFDQTCNLKSLLFLAARVYLGSALLYLTCPKGTGRCPGVQSSHWENYKSVNYCRKIEPVHEISNNVVCVISKASDQPAHTRSLIKSFASRLFIL